MESQLDIFRIAIEELAEKWNQFCVSRQQYYSRIGSIYLSPEDYKNVTEFFSGLWKVKYTRMPTATCASRKTFMCCALVETDTRKRRKRSNAPAIEPEKTRNKKYVSALLYCNFSTSFNAYVSLFDQITRTRSLFWIHDN
jgi:hypothetical protein